jgi:hypothetical protein
MVSGWGHEGAVEGSWGWWVTHRCGREGPEDDMWEGSCGAGYVATFAGKCKSTKSNLKICHSSRDTELRSCGSTLL